jgi:hypothetical protein
MLSDPKCHGCVRGIYRDASGEKQICPCVDRYRAESERIALAFAAILIGDQLTFAAVTA